jgi:leishmanolysin
MDYFSRLIKIYPKSADDMKWNYSNTNCGEAQIPPGDRTTGKTSDLHLYITYTVAPTETYLAYAGWCKFLKGIGPTHG